MRGQACRDILVVVILASSATWLLIQADVSFTHHNFTEVQTYLSIISEAYPEITHLYSIGKSVQGRDLWVLALGQSPREHVLLRPEVKYVGNIHGNEITGREVLLHLIDQLVTGYGTNQTITQMMQSMRIHILISLNPDGFENATNDVRGREQCEGIWGRYNAHGVDLNRNFPDYFDPNTDSREPESQAIMDWLKQNQFVLSGQLHDGAQVANYPYDNYKGSLHNAGARYSLSKDDDVFRHLAKSFSFAHQSMSIGEPCPGDRYGFEDGITNGADWYPVRGGMQDYNYIYSGCMELTLELSCCKYSPASQLAKRWQENKNALLVFLQQAHMGVKGIVTNEKGSPIQGALVSIEARDHPTKTTSQGEFWRLLLPGSYKLSITASGYRTKVVPFRVRESHVTVLSIDLKRPLPEHKPVKFTSSTYNPTTLSKARTRGWVTLSDMLNARRWVLQRSRPIGHIRDVFPDPNVLSTPSFSHGGHFHLRGHWRKMSSKHARINKADRMTPSSAIPSAVVTASGFETTSQPFYVYVERPSVVNITMMRMPSSASSDPASTAIRTTHTSHISFSVLLTFLTIVWIQLEKL